MPLSREALVAMEQPADLGDGDDAAGRRWLDGTRVRTILVELTDAFGLGGNRPRKMKGHAANGVR